MARHARALVTSFSWKSREESKLAVEVPYKYLVVPPRHPIHHHIPIPSLRLRSRLRQHNHTMSFNQFNNIRRHEILERMGIEQLPALMPGQEHPDVEPEERRPEVPLVMLPVSNNSYSPSFAAVLSDPRLGAWQEVPFLPCQGRNRLGHSRQMLPCVWHPCQLMDD